MFRLRCTNDDFKDVETFIFKQFYIENSNPDIDLYNVDTEEHYVYTLVNIGKGINDEFVYRERTYY